MKYTDYREVKNLAKNILLDAREMATLTAELNTQLRNLEGSFQDDGIEDVRIFVNALGKALNNSGAAFQTVASELVAYANLLEKGKR